MRWMATQFKAWGRSLYLEKLRTRRQPSTGWRSFGVLSVERENGMITLVDIVIVSSHIKREREGGSVVNQDYWDEEDEDEDEIFDEDYA